MLTDDARSIAETVSAMTLREKASLCGGRLPFETHSIERLGIPSFRMADGHNGINTYHLLANIMTDVAERRGMSLDSLPALPEIHQDGRRLIDAILSDRLDDPAVANFWAGERGCLVEIAEQLRESLPDARLPTCFPTGIVMGATWDPELVADCARAVALECLAFGLDVMLGPNVNIHRDVLGGRVFESCVLSSIIPGFYRHSFPGFTAGNSRVLPLAI